VSARVRINGAALSFRLRLTPKGGRDAIDGWMCGADGSQYLKARVAVPPEDGKANAALLALLSKSLGVAKSSIHIASGETARLKTIEISPAAASVAARLETMETEK
jgi:uncharacterized protein YggU (UPF0235/DUF167 family)